MPATPDVPATGALVDGLLGEVAEQLSRPLPARLRKAFHRVPRHWFLPDRIWLRDGSGGYRPVDRVTEPDGWLAAAYTDQPLVTRLTGGLPSSSASMPSMVARMLLLAGLTQPTGQGQAPLRVLELGAGAGFNAGLLCILAGDEQVTTVDLDPDLAAAWAVAGGDLDAEFHIGRTAPDASYAWDTSGDHAHTCLQIQDAITGSWATVDHDGRTAADFTVVQAGPRRCGMKSPPRTGVGRS